MRALASSASDEERTGDAKDRNDIALLKRTWQFVRPHRKHLFTALMLLPLSAALQLVPPYLLKEAIDNAIVTKELERLAPYALWLIGALLGQQVIAFFHALALAVCGQRAMHDMRMATHQHLLGLRVAYFDRTPLGRVMTRVTNDVESIAEAFSSGIFTLFGDVLMLAGIIAAMLWLDVRLALLTFCIIPPLFGVAFFFQRALRTTHRGIRRRLAKINGSLQEHINGMKIVQLFARQQRAAEDFDGLNREFRDGYKAAIFYDSTLYAVVELLGTLTIAAVLWYGGFRTIGGAATFGLLVAFVEYTQKFFIPIRDLSAKYAVMQQALASAERVFDLLDVDEPDGPTSTITADGPHNAQTAEQHVVFDHVKFGYHPSQPVLRDLSFSVAPGEMVAIIGATGAGKSTIARLLSRFYEIDKGTISLNGNDLRTLPIDALRRQVIVLNQDVYLFNGTVLQNITLDDPQITAKAAEAAAARVGLTPRVALEREVGERGTSLSAGERQLVVFARALVRDPELLVLDEATANIDPEAEKIVEAALAELLQRRTAIVIAHRLTTVERADRLLVMQGGALVEQGTHADLLAQQGLYATLYKLQYVGAPTA